MKLKTMFLGTAGISACFNLLAASVTVSVPGTATPYLAGLPDGTQSSIGAPAQPDQAPAQSPIRVAGIFLASGDHLTFQVTGLVSHCELGDPGGCCALDVPDGGDCTIGHIPGPENGISDIVAPYNSLVGIFLGTDRPDASSAPSRLDFSTSPSREYTVLSPGLKQVFFIGNGLKQDGTSQQVLVPTGATRLYLATWDSYGWFNNRGAFSVTVNTTTALESHAILSIDVHGGQAGITVNGVVGSTQRIEYSTTLAPNSWTPLTSIQLLQSPQFILDPTPIGTSPRFYRAVQEK